MRRIIVLLLAAIGLAVAWPNAELTSAAPSTVVAAMSSASSNRGGKAPIRFNLLAASWNDRKTDVVEYRTSLDGSAWTAWQELDAEDGEAPDADQPDAKRFKPGRFTGLAWVGDARYLQTRGVPAGKVHLLNVNGDADDPGGTTRALRSLSRWTAGTRAEAAGYGPIGIYTRRQWGANESLREQTNPNYAPQNKMALIHHTDTGNRYYSSDVPKILRGIYTYHVKSRGYRDIAYNFLVDRFGQLWEGRWGGLDKTVVGGHTAGFNYGTIGVAMLGNYSSLTPPAAMQSSIARLLSWKFTIHRIKPRATTYMTVRSSPSGGIRWKPGTVVRLNTISAHRDVNQTACNGLAGYRTLNWIRSRVWNKLPPIGSVVSDAAQSWYLAGGYVRLRIPSYAVLDTWLPRAQVLRLTPSELLSFPIAGVLNFRDGTLVKPDQALPEPTPSPSETPSPGPSGSPEAPSPNESESPTPSPEPPAPKTYIVSKGLLRPFASDVDVVAMRFDPARIKLVSAASLAPYRVGDPVDPLSYPDGVVLRSSSGGPSFMIRGGKRWTLTPAVTVSWNLNPADTVSLGQSVVDAIPLGGTQGFREGAMIRGDGTDRAVYVISEGRRRPIANAFVFTLLGYKSSNVRYVPASLLPLHRIGWILDGRGPNAY